MEDDIFNSNIYLDLADQYIVVPRIEDVQRGTSPEEYLNRLDELEKPADRLKTLFKAYCKLNEQPTHEAAWLRTISVTSFIMGGFFGSVLNSRGLHEEYIRKHNASVFQSQYLGNRHFYDTLLAGLVPRAISYGFKTCLLSTSVSGLCIGSITYRGKLYEPDWMVGFATIGGLSRLWLGSRAVAAGAVLGGLVSVLAISLVRCFELVSGKSVTQIRLQHHHEWVAAREAKRYALIKQQAESVQQLLPPV